MLGIIFTLERTSKLFISYSVSKTLPSYLLYFSLSAIKMNFVNLPASSFAVIQGNVWAILNSFRFPFTVSNIKMFDIFPEIGISHNHTGLTSCFFWLKSTSKSLMFSDSSIVTSPFNLLITGLFILKFIFLNPSAFAAIFRMFNVFSWFKNLLFNSSLISLLLNRLSAIWTSEYFCTVSLIEWFLT